MKRLMYIYKIHRSSFHYNVGILVLCFFFNIKFSQTKFSWFVVFLLFIALDDVTMFLLRRKRKEKFDCLSKFAIEKGDYRSVGIRTMAARLQEFSD